MNTSKPIYIITILDEMFGELTGDFEAIDIAEACRMAKEFYAEELDTTPEYIEILKVVIK